MTERVDERLLEILCCPACRGDLHYPSDADDMSCPACNFTYPVIDGIPVLFPTDVKSRFEELFGRYWDSEERAETYDTFVEGEDSLMGKHHHLGEIRATMEVLGQLEGGSLLDCGCGNGRFFEHYPKSVQVVGVDASLNLLRICKRKKRCELLVCCELEHLPFKTGSFDRTVSVRVLQHLQRQEEAVREMVRVLCDGGSTIIHCYNDWSSKAVAKTIRERPALQRVFNAPFHKLLGINPFAPWGIDYDNYSNVPQVQGWLTNAGATVSQVRGAGFGFNKWLVDGFMVAPALEKRAPGVLRGYLSASLKTEEAVGRVRPLSSFMEKFVIRAEKRP